MQTAQPTFMDRLAGVLKPVTESKHFDIAVGLISILNPLALVPQLGTVIVSSNVGGVSIGMWVIFVFIQSAFTLVAVKNRNLSMFLSMAVSVLISISIIIIVFMKAT